MPIAHSPDSLTPAGVEVSAEKCVWPAVACLRVHDYMIAVIDIARRGRSRLMPPEALLLFSIPMIVDEAWPGRDDKRHEVARLFTVWKTIEATV